MHPATKDLPLEWKRPDKWLNWAKNPSGEVHTVARVRESTYKPGTGANGWDHPVSWCRDYDGGRSFYTGMGGTVGSRTTRPTSATICAAPCSGRPGLAQADCKATITANYKAERLTQPNQPGQNDQIGEPHGLVTAPDGRVLYIGRGGADARSPVVTDWNNPDIGKGKGEIHVYDPKTKKVTLAGALTVFGNKGGGDELIKVEEGLLGIELDPDFAHQRLGVPALHPALEDQPRQAHGRAAGLPLHPRPRRPTSWTWPREKVLLELAGADPQLLPRGRRDGLGLQGQPVHRHR